MPNTYISPTLMLKLEAARVLRRTFELPIEMIEQQLGVPIGLTTATEPKEKPHDAE